MRILVAEVASVMGIRKMKTKGKRMDGTVFSTANPQYVGKLHDLRQHVG